MNADDAVDALVVPVPSVAGNLGAMDPHTRSSGHQRLRQSRQVPKLALLYCVNKQSIVGATTLLSCRGPPTSQCIEWTATNGVELTTHMKISQRMKRYEAPLF